MQNLIILLIIISIVLFMWMVIFDRSNFAKLMAVNCLSNCLLALICILSFFANNQSFIDIALIYSLLNFIAVSGFLKFYRDKIF